MEKSWRHAVLKLAVRAVSTQKTPLFFKSVGWHAIRFFSRCGKSNVLSYLLRPVVTHNFVRPFLGILLVGGMVWGASTTPLSSYATDTGGPEVVNSTTVIGEGEVHLKTTLAIRAPLPNLDVSQKFWLLHSGIDLRTPIGTHVTPLMRGVVSLVKNDTRGYGNYIIVTHENGYATLYAHLSKAVVKEGETVTTDSLLGLSGNTGRSTGPHLHFELHDHGAAVDPATVLGLK